MAVLGPSYSSGALRPSSATSGKACTLSPSCKVGSSTPDKEMYD